jgi:hypothetical protein
MDPFTLVLLLSVAGYCAAAPDRRTFAASRGAAGAVRAAAVGGTRQVRDDWRAGRPGRAATARGVRTRLKQRTLGSVAVAAWDCLRFAGRAGRGTARVGYRAGRAAASSARSGYGPSVERAETKRAERRQRRIDRRHGMEPGTGERPTTLTGNSRYKTDDWTVSLTPEADGTTRADIHYAGLPDLGAQPVTTVTGATPEEAQTRAEDAIAYQQMQHGKGAPARIAWIHPDPPAGASPSGSTTPPTTPGDDMKLLTMNPGELTTTSDLRGETKELRAIVEELREALAHLNEYLTGVGDRYAGAPFGTAKLSKAITNLGEQAKAVDPVVADHILEQAEALEEALTEAENLGEQASALAAEGEIHAFQPA